MNERPEYLEPREYLPLVRARIQELARGNNPAPWYFTDEALLASDDVMPKERLAAIKARADKTLFRAMLTGSLKGWFRDGIDAWQVPGWAWADQGGDWRGLVHGNDFLHPLLPAAVRRWAWLPVLIKHVDFKNWLASSEVEDQSGFPDLPIAYDENERLAHITLQDPPNTPNVSLSHAISWLALGISLDARTLSSALSIDAFGPDRSAVHHKIQMATERLVIAGTGGLPFLGKFVVAGGHYATALTEPIKRERLEDFRQFDLGQDGLRCASGFQWDLSQPGDAQFSRAFLSEQSIFFDVKVDRAGLMARFASMSVAETPQPVSIDAPKRRPPGPAADPDWPEAIAAVTDACIAAGYTRQLKRGEKTAIGTMLLNKMAERDKHFSPDIAAKHAARVIEALPDN